MKRFDYMINYSDLNKLAVVHRMPVAPGTSIKSQMQNITMKSDVFDKANLNPVLMSAYSFYCPLRLLWDDWMDFIAQDDDYAGTFPVTAVDFPAVLDKDASDSVTGSLSAMPRRAFKLAFNQYFGDEDFTTHYSDITNDADVTVHPMKNPDQYLSKVRDARDMDTPTYDATTVPIDLNDFAYEMQKARSRRRAQISGDKYVDALARMGVSLDWRVQQAPELLGKTHLRVRPRYWTDTTATTLGSQRSQYSAELKHRYSGKRFAEHGLVFTVVCARLIAPLGNAAPHDHDMTTIDDFYTGDDPRIGKAVDARKITTAVAGNHSYHVRKNENYLSGQNFHISGGYSTGYVAADISGAVYPEFTIAKQDLLTEDFCFASECETDIVTPVNRGY